ncbi:MULTISPECIES: DUF2796 domain-containing protein [unclassified Pseudomonas]|uniref:DUF2796 domain-containing protein n=1 Tax=unclassified Pseudomonas TaxID=196821 RepID=UPI00147582BC|nr:MULTISPECIES: DUF2796 domain-containing protein [unclassified Pseudomonas]NMY37412.1 DUF2796 domain-containing protein [Pseudomonas sp. WS 5078]NMY60153.1 DUF2796 domain-containing protein [Pseudomonas sp. WS 5354]
MRRLLLALPFALLPLAVVHAAQAHDHEHGSLAPHEHGVGTLNVALDDNTLELDLDSPAMNLVGFEHAATTDADKASVAAAKARLENPLTLFNLPPAAKCVVEAQELNSPLFDPAPEEGASKAKTEHHHSDVEAHYAFTCAEPGQLKNLDFGTFFKTFPGTHTFKVQLIGPNGQQAVNVSAKAPTLTF